MEKQEKTVSKKQSFIKVTVLFLSAAIIALTAYVLLDIYEPNRNALGALGTVCMDVISMAVLIIMLLTLAIEKDEIDKTTKLFFGLMATTVVALFFDFLNWALDGSLSFENGTFIYTLSSLCSGSILAGIFVLYLSSYLCEMYDLKSSWLIAKISAVCNLFSFVMTFILGFTKSAFTFENGHYVKGMFYDYVMVIPVCALLFMTGYTIVHAKKIGLHDVLAVVGYILTMVIGAEIEEIYNIGATYVAVAIADVYIYILLQNNLISRVRKQKEELAEKITSQFEILESMAGIYSYVNFVNLEDMTTQRFDIIDSAIEPLEVTNSPHSELNKGLFDDIDDNQKQKFWDYTDLGTLSHRMRYEKVISAEFYHEKEGWLRAQYIRIGEVSDRNLKKVIYAIRNIDEEKKNVENWIRKSNTDELTGFLNRHAYADDVADLEKSEIRSTFVYISIDVNSLKVTNDTHGHEAGDEMLVGACTCMKKCFGPYGKLYRTGGDEFVALINADDYVLEKIKRNIEEITANWHGKLIDHLAISCGFVTKKEAGDMTLHEMAVLADKRMYEAKTEYYQKMGIDRRGPRKMNE